MSELGLPALGVARYRSSGAYLRVSASEISLTAVNRDLRRSALADEKAYAVSAEHDEREGGKSGIGFGRYLVAPVRRLVSASSVVVSELVPVLEAYPAGVPAETWESLTVDVPSARGVGLAQLFSSPSQGLSVLAARAYREVLAGDSQTDHCVQLVQGRRPVGGSPPGAFAPSVANYEHFALTASGLAVGIPQGAVASDVCGRVEATIAYSTLRPYLSALGRRLVAGVREPASLG